MYVDLRTRPAEIKITYKCNLSCPACNVACFHKHGHPPDLTRCSFVKILDDIETYGFKKKLSIVGGEPTLHPLFVEFITLAYEREFFIKVYSNHYSKRSRELLCIIRKMVWSQCLQKPNGSNTVLDNLTVFCAPLDLNLTPSTCEWEELCGYSVDELGYSVCTIGSSISRWQNLDCVTKDLVRLLDPEWQEYCKKKLCQYCGAFLDQELVKSLVKDKYKNTLMTKSWLEVFTKEHDNVVDR